MVRRPQAFRSHRRSRLDEARLASAGLVEAARRLAPAVRSPASGRSQGVDGRRGDDPLSDPTCQVVVQGDERIRLQLREGEVLGVVGLGAHPSWSARSQARRRRTASPRRRIGRARMRVSWSRATSGAMLPWCTASCRADSVWERNRVGASSSCPGRTSNPSLARWRTTPQSTTNLVIGRPPYRTRPSLLRAGGLERLAERVQLGQEPEVPALGRGGRQLLGGLVDMVLGLGALALAQLDCRPRDLGEGVGVRSRLPSCGEALVSCWRPGLLEAVAVELDRAAESWQVVPGHLGRSRTGLRSKKPTGRRVKPQVATGITGQSSGRGKWVIPNVCHRTMSWPSMSRSAAT